MSAQQGAGDARNFFCHSCQLRFLKSPDAVSEITKTLEISIIKFSTKCRINVIKMNHFLGVRLSSVSEWFCGRAIGKCRF